MGGLKESQKVPKSIKGHQNQIIRGHRFEVGRTGIEFKVVQVIFGFKGSLKIPGPSKILDIFYIKINNKNNIMIFDIRYLFLLFC